MRFCIATCALLLFACGGESNATFDGGSESGGGGTSTDDDAGPVSDGAEDNCWWCTDASEDVEVPDTLAGSSTGGEGKEDAILLTLEGTLNVDTSEGTLRTVVADAVTEIVLCDMTQSVVEAAPNDTCEACVFAYDMSYGDAVLTVGTEEECLDEASVVTTLTAGHATSGELYFGGKDEGWGAYGTSSFEAPTWTFSTTLALGGGGGKDDDCYDDCIAKDETTEEVCADYCGGKDDGGKDDDGKDEMDAGGGKGEMDAGADDDKDAG